MSETSVYDKDTVGPEWKFKIEEVTKDELIQEAYDFMAKAINLLILAGADPHGKDGDL